MTKDHGTLTAAEIVEAVREDPSAVNAECADDSTLNKELLMACIAANGKTYRFIEPYMQTDRDLAFVSVITHGLALSIMGDPLRDDWFIVNQAVRQDCAAFQHASERLRGDTSIALAAISGDPAMFKYASEEIRGDRAIVSRLVESDGQVLVWASDELKADIDICRTACRSFPLAYTCVSDELKDDYAMAMSVVSADGLLLFHLPDHLKDDEQICRVAAANDQRALQYATNRIRDLTEETNAAQPAQSRSKTSKFKPGPERFAGHPGEFGVYTPMRPAW